LEFPLSNRFAQPPTLARTQYTSDLRGSASTDTRSSNYTTRTASRSGGSQFDSNRLSQDARRTFTPSSSGPLRTSNKYDAVAAEHHCFNCHSRNHRSSACDLSKRHASDAAKFFNRVVTQNIVRFVDHRRQYDDDCEDDVDFFSMNVAQQSNATSSNLLKVQVRVNGHDCVALVNSGASYDMMDHRLVAPSNLVRRRPADVEGFDGSNVVFTTMSDYAKTIQWPGTSFGHHDLVVTALDFTSNDFDVILGKPWFDPFDPVIQWRSNTIVSMQSTRSGLVPSSKSKTRLASNLVIKLTTVEAPTPVPFMIQKLLSKYQAHFPDELPDGMPPSRAVDFEVTLKLTAWPSARAHFHLSRGEQRALDKFVNKLLRKGWIELSTSPYVSEVFGVGKKDEDGKMPSRREWLDLLSKDPEVSTRWVLDYRYMNSQSDVPKIRLPNIAELFDRMHGVCVFSKINFASGYRQMLVVASSRKYTAFRTHNETYQWCVAPQGMAGMPRTWSRLMRLLFGRFVFVVVYLDDICVFFNSMEEHIDHLAQIFDVLLAERLYVRADKCVFGASSISFLGHVIGKDGLQVDERKVRAIERLAPPTCRNDLFSFLGLAGYYRKFVDKYATMVAPLSDLTKSTTAWTWTDVHEHAFTSIKLALQQS